jgi:hypothetical protein
MILDHVSLPIKPQFFLEWTHASFEQSLKECHVILLEEHFHVALELLELGISSST